MNSRALLTALLFGSAIAGTRLLAQVPTPEPKKPEQQAASADPAQCSVQVQNQAKAQIKRRALLGFARSLAGNLPMVGHSTGAVVAGQATAAAIDGAASVDTAPTPRCSG
jgi:hypothetical protein